MANGGVYGDGGISALVPSNDPFAQLGPTLDLTFAGNPTDLLTASTTAGYTLDTYFTPETYQIAVPYAIWEDGVGLSQKTFAQIVTFTRASTATYFNSAGTLTSAAVNEARFDYNPSTLAAQGLLIEEARTNLLLQSGWAGATSGSPGAAPTSWTLGFGTGTVTTVVSSTAGPIASAVRFDYDNTERVFFDQAITVTSGTQYAFSIYVEALSGAVAGDVLTVTNGTTSGTVNTFVTSPSVTGRYTLLFTANGNGTVFLRAGAGTTAALGGTGSITLSRPQCEAGAFSTSYIPTTTTALTRAADVASVNTLSPWYNSVEGTLYGEFTRGYTGNFKDFTSPAIITNNLTGANANSIGSVTTNGVNQQLYNSMVVNNVEQLTYQQELAQTTNKSALAYKTNDTQQFTNGVAEAADTSCTVPTSVSQMNIGAGNINIVFINSWIRRVTYYPRRLSQAEGIAITA
jgi:hypothetical protein